MFHFKITHLLLALGLTAPAAGFAASLCIAIDGGFGAGGGATFVAPTFAMPAASGCSPWAGFLKTADTVIEITSGTGCLSSNSKVLSFSIASADPEFNGSANPVFDYVTVCPAGVTACPISGSDQGDNGGTAKVITCTAALLKFPQTHD